ncbi:hypothetical protein K435DRAFT_857557 [Dendrothele bispora CBS 962.96]|uniref:Uncharacterized protein n=1 Tax=Dendrothele bispora (strain CBS 962.96) TaxID=1314807 RepID=A0A4V4HG58_DENBC|nr:hypothetical protein K435DRAFT_857557 [Dendrothele bispora CBS 962.96]
MELYGFTTPGNLNASFLPPDLSDPFRGKQLENRSGGVFYNWTNDSKLIVQFGQYWLFDYAVAGVAEFEDLHDQTIIVDDSNTEIQWGADARPHGNGTHESDKVGDYFIFQFQGTSILVAGIAPKNRTNEVPGINDDFHLKLNFTLDGYSQSKVFTNEIVLVGGGGLPHFPYFQNNTLAEGNHTLIMTVDDVSGNASVIIDYLTYKPSFPTLKDKPTFSPINLSNDSTPSPDPPPSPPAGSTRSNTGIIAGSVGGGVALLSLIALSIWLLYKKKQQTHQLDQRRFMAPSITSTQTTSDLVAEPFLFQNPTHPSPRKDTLSLQIPSLPLAQSGTPSPPQHAQLHWQREGLEETLQNLESQSGNTRSSDQSLVTQGQLREMLARVDALTREMAMGRYVDPPEYDSR